MEPGEKQVGNTRSRTWINSVAPISVPCRDAKKQKGSAATRSYRGLFSDGRHLLKDVVRAMPDPRVMA